VLVSLFLMDEPLFSTDFVSAVPGALRRIPEKLKPGKPDLDRGFAFTLFEYTVGDVEYLKDLFNQVSLVYLCFGAEICPKTHRPHLQGYIHFKSAKKWHQVVNILPATVHVTPARKSGASNRAYCCKIRDADPPGRPSADVPNDVFFEIGRVPVSPANKGAAEVARWEIARVLARKGLFSEIPADIYIRCRKTLKAIYFEERLSQQPKVLVKFEHLWLVGPTGTGKSHKAREVFPDFYDKLTNKWWCDYNFEETVLIDDIEPDHAKYFGGFLKRWADKWAFRAEVKGATISIRPRRIIVTSNFTIEDIFPEKRTSDPLLDRFSVVHFKVPLGGPVYKRIKVPWNVQLLEAKAAQSVSSQISECSGSQDVVLMSDAELAGLGLEDPVEGADIEKQMPDGFFVE
jgi:hypothetical protein